MRTNSEQELLEVYIDTLERCTPAIRNCTDEEMLCFLFEDFSVEAWTYLHEDNVARLQAAGLIDEQMVQESKEIRERWLRLEEKWLRLDPQTLPMYEIRHGREWSELFDLCESLRRRVMERNHISHV